MSEHASLHEQDTATQRPRRGMAPISWMFGILPTIFILGYGAWAGRNLWFFSDDWNIVSDYPSGNLLTPFNSHLSAVPVALYQGLFHTVGLGSYTPYRVLGLCSYGLLGLVVFRLAATRLSIVGASLASALVIWNSGGSSNLLFPFLLNFSLPIALLAVCWLVLDRGRGSEEVVGGETASLSWGSVLTVSGLLSLGLATSGLGLIAVAAVGIEFACRRDTWTTHGLQRAAALAVGPALWLVWYLDSGVENPPSKAGLGGILRYSVEMLFGGARSLGGGSRVGGFLVVCVVIVGGAVGMWRKLVKLTPRFFGAAAAPLVFVGLTARSRIGVNPAIPPDELRYRWTVAAYLVLAGLMALSRRASTDSGGHSEGGSGGGFVGCGGPAELPGWSKPTLAVTALAAVMCIVNLAGLMSNSSEWVELVEGANPGAAANLRAAELAHRAGGVDSDRRLAVSLVPVTAGKYLAAVNSLGSPLKGTRLGLEYANMSETERAELNNLSAEELERLRLADQLLIDELGLSVATPAGPAKSESRLCSVHEFPSEPSDSEMSAGEGRWAVLDIATDRGRTYATSASGGAVGMAVMQDPAHATTIGILPPGETVEIKAGNRFTKTIVVPIDTELWFCAS